MKKVLCIVFCIAIIPSLYGQEFINVPSSSPEQKIISEIYSQWDILSSAISYTKSYGVSPNEFGKYAGSLFASRLKNENGFTYYCQQIINNWESWRTNEDAAVYTIKKTDESLVFKVSLIGLQNYFDEKGTFGVSFDEIMQYIKGIEEQIANHLKYTINIEIKEEWSPCTARWYSYAIITVIKNDLTT